jgi:hypothetical protein
VEVALSARKHGVDYEDMLHALRNPVRAFEAEPEGLLVIGPSRDGQLDARDLREVPIEDLRAITSLAATIREADAALSGAVERARRDGHTWSQIGTALGVSKQAAQQRFD